MTKPTFICFGAQKCASTWVRDLLHDHPEVYVSYPREVDFFSHHYNHGYTWYERHFDDAGNVKAIGEISPSYFCEPLAPERVHEYVPEVRLILTLRDPVARAFSNHLHEIRTGHYYGADLRFETGLESNPMYVFQSRYGTHLARWLEVFPKDRILVLVQEDIQRDPITQSQALYRFLGIDTTYQSSLLFQRRNASIGARNAALYNAWRMVGDFGRSHGLGRAVEAVKRMPPIAQIMAANRRDLRAEIPKMQPETERALRQLFTPEVLTLAELLDRYDWPWPTWQAATTEAHVPVSAAE